MNDASPSSAADSVSAIEDRSPGAFRWHIVVGVLGLLYGLGGMLLWLALAAMTLAWKPMMKAAGMGDVNPPPGSLIVNVAMPLVLVILGLLLAVGSAMLLTRRPGGAKLMRAWAYSRLLMVAIGLAAGIALLNSQVDFAIEMNAAQRDMMRANGQDVSKFPELTREGAEQQSRYTLLGLAVIPSAFPIFVALLLTNRRKLDDIESWHQILR